MYTTSVVISPAELYKVADEPSSQDLENHEEGPDTEEEIQPSPVGLVAATPSHTTSGDEQSTHMITQISTSESGEEIQARSIGWAVATQPMYTTSVADEPSPQDLENHEEGPDTEEEIQPSPVGLVAATPSHTTSGDEQPTHMITQISTSESGVEIQARSIGWA